MPAISWRLTVTSPVAWAKSWVQAGLVIGQTRIVFGIISLKCCASMTSDATPTTVPGETGKPFSTSESSSFVRTCVALPKVPSKTAKFHLQIVDNRLKFQSKVLPAGRRALVGTRRHEPRRVHALARLPQQEPLLRTLRERRRRRPPAGSGRDRLLDLRRQQVEDLLGAGQGAVGDEPPGAQRSGRENAAQRERMSASGRWGHRPSSSASGRSAGQQEPRKNTASSRIG